MSQTATAEKSNEITAIRELLTNLRLGGCIVTFDAMGTQTDTPAPCARKAGYVMCAKDNHLKFAASILLAQTGVDDKFAEVSRSETTTEDGRTELPGIKV
ncbi:ISAs1 family transposase [Aromatoleum toluclasticum]|uniref:ISAs1 family transposase n=1 Tax=Aromatoleum toluclasticum TaxID=92003 RepID=UPI00037E9420|nr:ISAs1 family transposase [Aromatoleum toluclasticum]